MKYQEVKEIGIVLGKMLAEYLLLPKVGSITAVPMHPSKENRRGFNQAVEIAKSLADHTNQIYLPLLEKTHATTSQASSTSRLFRLQKQKHTIRPSPIARKLLAQKSFLLNLPVMLVDDVGTTGSTLNEAALALKQLGFTQVVGVVVAHSGL